MSIESAGSASAELPDFGKLWDFSDPAATEQKFREVLALPGADRLYVLMLRTQIARSQGLQREFDAAHATLDQVEGELDSATARVRVRYLLERGRVFNSSKQLNSARPLFVQALEIATEAGEDNFAVDAAHMLGIIEPPDEALRWNEKAMQLAEASADAKARNWLGTLYNNIGWAHHDKGDFELALQVFEKALAWYSDRADAKSTRIAKWSVARTLRSLGQIEAALRMQQDLLREFENVDGSDGYVFEELAECNLLLNQPEFAKPHFARAHAELSQDSWLAANEPERIARLKELGEG